MGLGTHGPQTGPAALNDAPASSVVPISGSVPGPKRYGRYVLIDRMGEGGMAEVFRALVVGPEQFQRMVVVKRVLPSLSARPGFIKMFIDEATLCGRLSHPNIIQVHEFGREGGQYFIVMEYVQGRNLNHVVSRLVQAERLMPPTIAAEITRQLCRGLAYAHGLTAVDGKPLGIIHRDVSPGNVMVSYAGAVKVLDFGIARVQDKFRTGSTDPGHVKGKSAYLAPEQLSHQGFDHRADIFATGIVLHEMLTGRRLFKAATGEETMQRVRSMPIPRPSQANPKVPAGLDSIVMRALQRSPAERYPNAGQMADALEAYLLEQRFSSQELPRFITTLFKDDGSHDQVHLTPQELQAVMEDEAAAPVRELTGEVAPVRL